MELVIYNVSPVCTIIHDSFHMLNFINNNTKKFYKPKYLQSGCQNELYNIFRLCAIHYLTKGSGILVKSSINFSLYSNNASV